MCVVPAIIMHNLIYIQKGCLIIQILVFCLDDIPVCRYWLIKVSHELLHVPASLAASHAEAHARHGTTEVPVVASHNTGREGRLTPSLIVFLKTWKTYINVLYTEITNDECGMPL